MLSVEITPDFEIEVVRKSLIESISHCTEWDDEDRYYLELTLEYYSTPEQWKEYKEEHKAID